MPKLPTINKKSTSAFLDTLVGTSPIGTIIRVNDYEASMELLLAASMRATSPITVIDIRPGTSLYSQYGASHIIVSENPNFIL